ncbi:hypothetical protein BALOs_1018 [Halobacteriovorax sp. BALOs_7]|uniref:Peptidase M48 domain-containing protein n=1 Tax=Halobacteriovorax vibrionivorans TaxID=2152716 RepID=A0ABY0IES5_9BACT|nr:MULTISPECIES: hypothetical protein [Halobacteriovorax]AYF44028.1 hypothetical protein BALOs_1018 [Halobacteriovorax sp. BALOs_7]RZF21446.1 hypothetical protein DAY19_07100 [Halobacteriovorax vibrionivorans]TGD48719.1 hypothetical protein EP118_02575 [Halobacteriovorax sp. Y22]
MKNFILLVALVFLASSSFASVTRDEFLQVKEALYQAYSELAPSQNEVLKINLPIPGIPNADTYWWDIDMVHASYVKVENDQNQIEHRIYLMGGFARLSGMTPDGLALTGCHEIGHGIGGEPFKSSGSTTEGQSDYFATKVCLPIVFKYLNELREINSNPTYESICSNQIMHNSNTCLRLLTAMEADQAFFKTTGDEVYFDHFSNEVATELNTDASYYPDSQCRFDTMIHGILNIERPICWYPGGAANGTMRQ